MLLAGLSGVISAVTRLGDSVVPKTRQVALRTFPDFDDQGRELIRALHGTGVKRVVWLTADSCAPQPPVVVGADDVRWISAHSIRGLFALWRSRVVIHTHGIGFYRPSRRTTCVNIWHGMPIKRLDPGSDVGRWQTDVTIATSDVHARNLAETWRLRPEQVRITGLPRNDALVRASRQSVPLELSRIAQERRLVVWLPTYRQSAVGQIRSDGVDQGNVFQIPGASPELVNELAASLDVQLIVKSHPMAPRPDRSSLSNLEVWCDADLAAAGLTLYELLGHAAVLITDQSSVWVDFLLTERPIVFAISDLEEYERTRGYYYSPLRDALPGPVVGDLETLRAELGKALSGSNGWEVHRHQALSRHHLNADASSAERVAQLVIRLLAGDGR